MEIKDFKNRTQEEQDKMVDTINAAIKAVGGKNTIGSDGGAKLDKNQSNSRGWDLDHIYTVGKVDVAKVTDTDTAYPAVFLDGQPCSLRNFIRYSASGYETSGAFEQQSGTTARTKTDTITAKVSDEYNSEDNFMFREYTNAWVLYYDLVKGVVKFPDSIKFMGKVCRPWTAKKASPAASFEKYFVGAKRVSTLNVWAKG